MELLYETAYKMWQLETGCKPMHSGKTKQNGDITQVGVTHIWYGRGGKQEDFCPCLEWNPGFLASKLVTRWADL
jgi:hypothetical protein